MNDCYLSLGSNLKSPERQLRQAVKELHKLPRCVVTHLSTLYVTQPWGRRAQPLYRNMVLRVETSLPAERLLFYCQQIENKHQRLRKKHWGARTLDIDLLLYGTQQIKSPRLTVPHRYMLQRDFVLIPLLEISPNVCLPGGEPISSYAKWTKRSFKTIHKSMPRPQ